MFLIFDRVRRGERNAQKPAGAKKRGVGTNQARKLGDLQRTFPPRLAKRALEVGKFAWCDLVTEEKLQLQPGLEFRDNGRHVLGDSARLLECRRVRVGDRDRLSRDLRLGRKNYPLYRQPCRWIRRNETRC
jgi:hypothetical protein